MSRVILENVHVHYPVLNDHYLSLRRAFLRLLTGGRLYKQDAEMQLVHALRGISLTIEDGDRLALVGRNGAGKSTLLKTIGGFIRPHSGQLSVDGRTTSLFNANGGMDVERTGLENVFLMGRLYGVARKDMEKHIQDIAEFSELGRFLTLPVRSYSDGMKVRLASPS